jgi:hypothetical protein
MAKVICKDVCLWVKHVGCPQTRVMLLALEPGSQVWLSVAGQPILFERMKDGTDGRSTRRFNPVGETRKLWLQHYEEQKEALLDFEFVERPLDAGKAGSGYNEREGL